MTMVALLNNVRDTNGADLFDKYPGRNTTSKLYRSFAAPSGHSLYNFSSTYDQALAVIDLTINNHTTEAKALLNFFKNELAGRRFVYAEHNAETGAVLNDEAVRVGDMIWIGLAAYQYQLFTGDTSFQPFMTDLADYCQDYRQPGGQFKGGKDKNGSYAWTSTEQNIDAYAFYDLLYKLTGNSTYAAVRDGVKNWLMNTVYDPVEKRFFVGLNTIGGINNGFATDTHSWGILALFPVLTNDQRLSLATFAEQKTKVGFGFDFTTPRLTGAPLTAISYEWTAQMALAYKHLGQYNRSDPILAELDSILASQNSIPYCSAQIDTTFSWIAYPLPSLASLIWYNFAKIGFNPLHGPYRVDGYVRDTSGNGISGVIISVNNVPGVTRTSDSNGYYTFSNMSVDALNYVLVPSKDTLSFSPSYALASNQEYLNTVMTSVPAPIDPRDIYGVLSQTYPGAIFGGPSQNTNPPGAAGGATLSDDTANYKEGDRSLKTVVRKFTPCEVCGEEQWGGWYISFKNRTDMNHYDLGSISFWLKSQKQIELKVESSEGAASKKLDSTGNNWSYITVPLTSLGTVGIDFINLDNMTVPAGFWASEETEFWVDDVIWRPSNPPLGSLEVTLRNRSDNALASEVKWGDSSVSVGATNWKVAEQYIEMKMTQVPPSNGTAIQIYTDNTSPLLSPRYTGFNNPAGLVAQDAAGIDPLPTAWRITDSPTNELTVMQGAPGYPQRLWVQESGNTFPCFLWMLDRATRDIDSIAPGNQPFYDGFDYATLWEYNHGIHFAEGENDWGAAQWSNYVYLAADFTKARTPRTYKGNVIVELFNE